MAEFGKGIRFYMLALGLVATGVAHADWRWLNPQPQGNLLADVVYGNQFVAVGNSGTILTSPDGAPDTWTAQDSGTNEWLYAIEWVPSESKYVTVGNNRTILTGSGSNWSSQPTPGPYTFLYAVAHHGNVYVAVGSSGSILYSTDGGATWRDDVSVPWSTSTPPWLNDVAWADGKFIAVGAEGTVITSTDGVNWTREPLTTPSSLEAVAWNGTNLRVAIGSWATGAANVYVSDSGGPWNPVYPGTAANLNGIHWDGAAGQFIAVGDRGEILTFDGQTWRSANSNTQQRLEKVASNPGGTLVTVGDFGIILRSTDQGQNWNDVTAGSRKTVRAVAVSSGSTPRYVAVGEQGEILTGDVGAIPQSVRAYPEGPNAPTLNNVAWNNLFVAVGTGGTIVTSNDGVSWSSATSGTGQDLWGIAPTSQGWVAVGGNGTVLTSTDGSQWTAASSGTGALLRDVAFNGGTYVAVGSGGTVITSSDGQSWSARSVAQNADLWGVTATDSQWVAVGGNTDPNLTSDAGVVLTSQDGSNWTVQAADIAEPLRDVASNGNTLYTAGGMSSPKRKEGLLLVSSDGGQSWARQSATGNDLLGLGVRGSTVMAVGTGGTVLESRCPCATDDVARTIEGQSVTIDVLANDVPGDNGGTLSIAAFDDRNGAIKNNGDGTLTYTPPEGFTGEDTFGYTITDGTNRDVGTVTVTVEQAPYSGSGGGSTGSGSGGGGGGLVAGVMLLGMWGLLLMRRRGG